LRFVQLPSLRFSETPLALSWYLELQKKRIWDEHERFTSCIGSGYAANCFQYLPGDKAHHIVNQQQFMSNVYPTPFTSFAKGDSHTHEKRYQDDEAHVEEGEWGKWRGHCEVKVALDKNTIERVQGQKSANTDAVADHDIATACGAGRFVHALSSKERKPSSTTLRTTEE
jgi:hypothetical protein